MYARYISETQVQYPTDAEFKGIPNWWNHDAKLREKGYAPLIGEPEPREGYVASPSRFALHQQTKTKVEPRPYEVEDFDPETGEKTGSHTEWRDTPVTVDDSWIEITDWTYTPPEPAPLPTRFSKGTLLEALMACNLYNEAKVIYTGDIDLQIAWAGFSEIDLDYPATQAIMRQYPALFSQQNVQMLLEWIKDNA